MDFTTVQILETWYVKIDQNGGESMVKTQENHAHICHFPHAQPSTWLSSLYNSFWISINYLQNKDLDSSVTAEKISVKKKEWIRTIRTSCVWVGQQQTGPGDSGV